MRTLFVATLSLAAAGLAAQAVLPDRLANGSLAQEEAEPAETNASRAERLLRDTHVSPKEKHGPLPASAFKALWRQGLGQMFAKTADGKLVQIRAFGEDGELRDLKQGADAVAESPKQSARILNQIDEGRYLGRFSTNPSQYCAIDIPGPTRADGDIVGGRFERVGVLKLNGRNLAHYRWLGEEDAHVSAASGSASGLQAADIQSVYNAFRKGEITFVLPGSIPQPCLACEGTGRQYDEAAIEKEAMADFKSAYNYSSSDIYKKQPKKSYEQIYQETKKKATFGARLCPDCRGNRKVPTKIFVKYSIK